MTLDGTEFDTISKRLVGAATRRRMMGGLLGSAAILTGAALATTDADAKKGGKGKGKGRGKNKGKAKGKTKVSFCHKSGNDFEFIIIGAPAAKAHRNKHGDVECVADPCNTLTKTCNEDGTCGVEPVVSEEPIPCEVDGVEGTCVEGVCETESPVEE